MLTLLALLAGVAPAPRATITAPPRPLVAGKAWNATLVVKPAPRKSPKVVARSPSGRAVVFATRRVGRGRYKVRLVLDTGRWTLSARIGRRTRVLRRVTVSPPPPSTSPLPGGTAYRVCGGAREPFLQYGLAVGLGSAWVACREQRAVQRIDLASGTVAPTIDLGEPVWAITAGEGSVWAVSLRGTSLVRINPGSNTVQAVIPIVGADVPYIWTGGGALWAANDSGRELLRFDPATNDEVARVPVGNGPAGFAFDDSFVWILNHRENTLDRIDSATNGVTRMGTIPGGEQVAAERIAVFDGSLWISGRGLDLLRVSPANGAVVGTTEIGTGGIDVVTDGANLWVVAYTPEGDARGEPLVAAVLKIDASGGIVATVTPTRVLHADGVAAANGQLWIFDAVAGLLVRLPA